MNRTDRAHGSCAQLVRAIGAPHSGGGVLGAFHLARGGTKHAPRRRMRVAPHIRASVTADGILFLDIANGRIFSANTIGAHVWNRLQEGWSVADVAREIACESGVDEDRVRRDVDDFTLALRARGFLLGEQLASPRSRAPR